MFFTDITAAMEGEQERDRLIRELDVERARLADVFRQAPVAVAVLRGRSARELVYELVNPRYVEMVPGRRSPVGRRIEEMIPEARDAIFTALQQVLDTGQPFLATDIRPARPRPRRRARGLLLQLRLPSPARGGRLGVGDRGHRHRVTDSVRARREAERVQHIAESAERRLAFLAEASARLAGSLDVESTLRTIAELAGEGCGRVG